MTTYDIISIIWLVILFSYLIYMIIYDGRTRGYAIDALYLYFYPIICIIRIIKTRAAKGAPRDDLD